MKTCNLAVMLSLVLVASMSAQQAPGGARPVASVRELHEIVITPASDAVFRAAGDLPTTDQAWRDARKQAIMLAESGNLLMLGGRARDNTGWMKLSRALVDAAAGAAAAAGKKDAKALEAAGDSITTACETCHRPYRDGGRQMGSPR